MNPSPETPSESPVAASPSPAPISQRTSNPKFFRLLTGGIIAFIVVGVLSAMSAAVYLLPASDPLVHGIASVVPYPAAVVNGSVITFGDYYSEQAALTRYLESSGVPADSLQAQQMESEILDTLIEKAVVQKLANEYNIELDQTEVDALMQDTYAKSGSEEEFLRQVEEIFGWTREDFIEHVINPIVLATQVRDAIRTDAERQKDKRERIEGALARINGGELFATVASEVSEDFSAASGGDLGVMQASDIPPEIAAVAETLELGVTSEVIETADLYAIVQVSDRTVAEGEEPVAQFNLHAIIVFKRDLQAVVDEYLAQAQVWRLLKS